jgi:hypothetical protein
LNHIFQLLAGIAIAVHFIYVIGVSLATGRWPDGLFRSGKPLTRAGMPIRFWSSLFIVTLLLVLVGYSVIQNIAEIVYGKS